jgi:hypothetical protein
VLEGELAPLVGGTTAAQAAEIAALWTEESTHGGVLGTRPTRVGRAAVQQMWTAGMTQRPKDYARRAQVTVASIQWLRPDLVAVDARVFYSGGTRADGTPAPDATEGLFALMTREASRDASREASAWRIAASRIGPISAPAGTP